MICLISNINHCNLPTGWNILDFIVVALAYISLAAPSDLTSIRTLRVLRALRLFRSKKMQVITWEMHANVHPVAGCRRWT